jgi:hypothetical protein
MKAGLIALTIAATFITAIPQSSEGRTSRRHGYCTYVLHDDYSRSNALSPMSSVYPAANWGPFFQCHMYYAPVSVYLPAAPAPD